MFTIFKEHQSFDIRSGKIMWIISFLLKLYLVLVKEKGLQLVKIFSCFIDFIQHRSMQKEICWCRCGKNSEFEKHHKFHIEFWSHHAFYPHVGALSRHEHLAEKTSSRNTLAKIFSLTPGENSSARLIKIKN